MYPFMENNTLQANFYHPSIIALFYMGLLNKLGDV